MSLYESFLLLNMFRMLSHSSSGAGDCLQVHCSVSVCTGVLVRFGWSRVVSECRLEHVERVYMLMSLHYGDICTFKDEPNVACELCIICASHQKQYSICIVKISDVKIKIKITIKNIMNHTQVKIILMNIILIQRILIQSQHVRHVMRDLAMDNNIFSCIYRLLR